jgi:ribosomal protein S18 acetylase RimI-like enzyme
MTSLRSLTSDDLPRLCQFWIEHWGGEEMVTRGNIYRPEQLDGFVVEDGKDWIGLLTFIIKDEECEVTSLDSLREGQGIGTQLIDAVIAEARRQKCRRVFLITTNDNTRAPLLPETRLRTGCCSSRRGERVEKDQTDHPADRI